MRRHRALLSCVDAWAKEQERIAETEDLQQVAEDVRNKILHYLEAHRNGQPLPMLVSSEDRDSPARDRLRQRLEETRERLMRFGGIRERLHEL